MFLETKGVSSSCVFTVPYSADIFFIVMFCRKKEKEKEKKKRSFMDWFILFFSRGGEGVRHHTKFFVSDTKRYISMEFSSRSYSSHDFKKKYYFVKLVL
jgi:hypothetical protein